MAPIKNTTGNDPMRPGGMPARYRVTHVETGQIVVPSVDARSPEEAIEFACTREANYGRHWDPAELTATRTGAARVERGQDPPTTGGGA